MRMFLLEPHLYTLDEVMYIHVHVLDTEGLRHTFLCNSPSLTAMACEPTRRCQCQPLLTLAAPCRYAHEYMYVNGTSVSSISGGPTPILLDLLYTYLLLAS